MNIVAGKMSNNSMTAMARLMVFIIAFRYKAYLPNHGIMLLLLIKRAP
jgi:hypothetical protein